MKQVCIFFIVFFNITFSLAAKENPETTLINIQKAIDTHNVELFNKYVAVKKIVADGVTVFLNKLSSKEGYKVSPTIRQLSFFIQSPECLASIHKLLVKEIIDFVHYGVSSGFFAGSKSKSQTLGLLPLLMINASQGRKEIIFSKKDLVLAQKQNGKEISLPLMVKDHGNGECYPVIVTMRDYSSIWVIDNINNIDILLQQMEYEGTN